MSDWVGPWLHEVCAEEGARCAPKDVIKKFGAPTMPHKEMLCAGYATSRVLAQIGGLDGTTLRALSELEAWRASVIKYVHGEDCFEYKRAMSWATIARRLMRLREEADKMLALAESRPHNPVVHAFVEALVNAIEGDPYGEATNPPGESTPPNLPSPSVN